MSILYNIFHKKQIAEEQQKYNTYKEKFKLLDIDLIWTHDIGVNYLDKIYKQLVILFKDNPEIPKGFLSKIYIGNQAWYDSIAELNRDYSVMGTTRWIIENNKLKTSIFISTDVMTEHDFWKREITFPLNPGTVIEGTVTHEFAHVMEYYLLYCTRHWENTPTLEEAFNAIDMKEPNKLGQFISEETDLVEMCEHVISQLGIPREFKYRPIATVGPLLGSNANTNYQEMFAEALTQYYCSDEPLEISKLVYKEFNSLKQRYMKDKE